MISALPPLDPLILCLCRRRMTQLGGQLLAISDGQLTRHCNDTMTCCVGHDEHAARFVPRACSVRAFTLRTHACRLMSKPWSKFMYMASALLPLVALGGHAHAAVPCVRCLQQLMRACMRHCDYKHAVCRSLAVSPAVDCSRC